MGNSLRGVEEEIGVVSSEVDDEDMIFPCLDVTLKVLHTIPFFLRMRVIILTAHNKSVETNRRDTSIDASLGVCSPPVVDNISLEIKGACYIAYYTVHE